MKRGAWAPKPSQAPEQTTEPWVQKCYVTKGQSCTSSFINQGPRFIYSNAEVYSGFKEPAALCATAPTLLLGQTN